MGTGLEWIIPAAITAVGTGAQIYDQRQTAKRQDNQLARQIQQQGTRQAEADRAVQQSIADRAASDASQERGSAANNYLQQARAAQAQATGGLRQAGAVSDAYRQSANDAALGVADYGATAANLMARIDAPMQQRQREALQGAQLQTDLGLIGGRAAGDDFLARLRLQGIRGNPWVQGAGQLATSVGTSMAANGWGQETGPTTAGMLGYGQANQFGSEAGNWFRDPALRGAR